LKQEDLKLSDGGWLLKKSDGLHTEAQADTCGVEAMTQELHGAAAEDALVGIGDETTYFAEAGKKPRASGGGAWWHWCW
jgi:hypothetical protein